MTDTAKATCSIVNMLKITVCDQHLVIKEWTRFKGYQMDKAKATTMYTTSNENLTSMEHHSAARKSQQKPANPLITEVQTLRLPNA